MHIYKDSRARNDSSREIGAPSQGEKKREEKSEEKNNKNRGPAWRESCLVTDGPTSCIFTPG